MKPVSLLLFYLAGGIGLVRALPASPDGSTEELMKPHCRGLSLNDSPCDYDDRSRQCRCPQLDETEAPAAAAAAGQHHTLESTVGNTNDWPCCCCDISIPAISCKPRPRKEDCICALVMCPPGSPTVWPGATPSPSPSPSPTTASPTPTPSRSRGDDRIECCCCDISHEAISCSIKDAADGCFCVDVVCPAGASTTWPYGAPASSTFAALR